jgi:hypothetical protein
MKDENRHDVTLHMDHIKVDMRDVAFYFHKKTGIPKIKDSGIAAAISLKMELLDPISQRSSVAPCINNSTKPHSKEKRKQPYEKESHALFILRRNRSNLTVAHSLSAIKVRHNSLALVRS